MIMILHTTPSRPYLFCWLCALLAASPVLADTTFVRGDVDQSGAIDLTDPIGLFDHLFRGGTAPICRDAADANVVVVVVYLSDSIAILQHLFLGTFTPEAPFPLCGAGPTKDDLECERFQPCSTCDGCESPHACVPFSADSFTCTAELNHCGELVVAYEHLTRELGLAYDAENGCHLVTGRCDEQLGGCYFLVGTHIQQQWISAVLDRYEELGCFGPKCDCPPPPKEQTCVSGRCEFGKF